MARWDLPPGTPGADAVARAHDQARELMAELRDLIHGIHPHVLTDLGLPAALRDLADRYPTPTEPDTVQPGRDEPPTEAPGRGSGRVDADAEVPDRRPRRVGTNGGVRDRRPGRVEVEVEVEVEISGRLPERVEATAYFVAAEALTNAARHSGAGLVQVTARQRRGELTAEVTDDGRGGVNPAAGSGLTGLADRVAATGGRMLLSSHGSADLPPNGPPLTSGQRAASSGPDAQRGPRATPLSRP